MNIFDYEFSSLSEYQDLATAALSSKQISQIVQAKKDFFSLNNTSYIEKQSHSELIDHLYGLNIESIEEHLALKSSELYKNYEIWAGLNPRQLQTPYDELMGILKLCNFNSGDSLMDLGAGYGRAGIIIGEHYRASSFLGIEIVNERVVEGNRVFKKYEMHNCELITSSAHNYALDEHKAQIFFLYDFGHPLQIERSLEKLVNIAFKEPFYLVARGRGVRSIVDYKFPQFWSSFTPFHGETYSIYSTFCDVTLSEI